MHAEYAVTKRYEPLHYASTIDCDACCDFIDNVKYTNYYGNSMSYIIILLSEFNNLIFENVK